MTTNVLDGLLARVADADLRSALSAEVARLRDAKDFGLVFERHFPEHVRLYSHPVKRGLRVQLRDSAVSDQAWLVARMKKDGQAILVDADGVKETRSVEELVVIREFGETIYPGIEQVGSIRKAIDKRPHIVLKGENYHALQSLLYLYEGRVDCIYIDPPYNSGGARDWKYNNDYVDETDAYRHSKWLAFMERRLLLAKRLLNPEDSVLIVTIDEKEYLRLGLLLEQVFLGTTIQMVTTVIKPEGTGRSNEFSRTNEFIFYVMIGNATISPGLDNMYDSNVSGGAEGVEWRLLRRRERTSVRGSRPNQFYAVFVDRESGGIHSVGDALDDDVPRASVRAPRGTRAVFPLNPEGKEMIWSLVPTSLRALVESGFARARGTTIQFLNSGTIAAIKRGDATVTGRDNQGAVIAEFVAGKTVMPKTVWTRESHNAQTFGTLMLSKLLPGREFPYPKSLYAVEDTLRFFIKKKPEAIVLDFFGGSGTTTHAVARLNHQDGGKRQSILVTNNEVSADEARSLRLRGLRPGDVQWEDLGIYENITRPRIEAAFSGRTPDGHPVMGEYRGDEFPIADGFEENVEFFELSYLDRNEVSRVKAFHYIAPLLWLKAGSSGAMINQESQPFAVPEDARYAILFDINHWQKFADRVRGRGDLTHIFVVTDSLAQYQQVVSELPANVGVSMLYEDYIRNFEINVAGVL